MTAGPIRAGQAFVEITARDEKFRRDLEANTRRVKQFVRNATAAAAVVALAAGSQAINAASRMEETLNKFNVVFGENREAMRQWGDEFAAQVGRSQQQVADFLAGTQDLLVPAGIDPAAAEEASKTLTALAVDVASFNNKLDADVLRDFHAALTGGGETVKKYGVILNVATTNQELLNQGINPKEATDAQKVFARLQVLLRGTTAAQGDAVRSAGSYANQMKALEANLDDLSVQLGNAILPAVTHLVELFNGGLSGLTSFVRGNQELVTVITGMASAVAAAAVAFGAINLALAVYARRVAIAQAFSGPAGWATLLAGAAAAAVAIKAVGAALDEADKQTEMASESADKLTRSLGEQADAVEKLTDRNKELREARLARQEDDYQKRLKDTIELQDSQRTSTEKLKDQLAELMKLEIQAGRIQRRTGRAPEGFDQVNLDQIRDRLINSATGFGDELKSVRDELSLLSGDLTETDIKLRDLEDAGVPVDKIEELRAALERVNEVQRQNELQDEMDRVREQIELVTGAATEADIRIRKMLENNFDPAKVEEFRQQLERLNLAERRAAEEERQEQRKNQIVQSRLPIEQQDDLKQAFRDIRELVAEGRLTDAQGQEELFNRIAESQENAAQRQAEEARRVRAESSVDLRTAEGSKLIADALNGRVRVEQQIASNTRLTAERLKEIVDNEDQAADV